MDKNLIEKVARELETHGNNIYCLHEFNSPSDAFDLAAQAIIPIVLERAAGELSAMAVARKVEYEDMPSKDSPMAREILAQFSLLETAGEAIRNLGVSQ